MNIFNLETEEERILFLVDYCDKTIRARDYAKLNELIDFVLNNKDLSCNYLSTMISILVLTIGLGGALPRRAELFEYATEITKSKNYKEKDFKVIIGGLKK
jgi:hypothetical protein